MVISVRSAAQREAGGEEGREDRGEEKQPALRKSSLTPACSPPGMPVEEASEPILSAPVGGFAHGQPANHFR